jgi:chromosome segregation ATPase
MMRIDLRTRPLLLWWLAVLLLAAGQCVWAANDEAAEQKMRDVQATLKEQLTKEGAALQQLSNETLDLDRQIEAVKELVMMKNDLEKLKREHGGMAINDEVARTQFEDAKAVILQSAEQVQAAKTNRDIERAMQMAKDKIEEIKRQLALVQRADQDREKTQSQLTQELKGLNDWLQDIRRTYHRQLAADEKIARQLDKLAIEVGKLQAKLKTLTRLEDIQEVARAIDAVREKIDILQSKLRLMGRTGMTARQMQQGMAILDSVIDAPAEYDDFLTQPLERLRFLQFLKQFRQKLVDLFYNTVKYFWTDEAGGVTFLGRVLLALMALALVNSALIWRKH